jgi:hypothetical protein
MHLQLSSIKTIFYILGFELPNPSYKPLVGRHINSNKSFDRKIYKDARHNRANLPTIAITYIFAAYFLPHASIFPASSNRHLVLV